MMLSLVPFHNGSATSIDDRFCAWRRNPSTPDHGATTLGLSTNCYPSREADHHDCQLLWIILISTLLHPYRQCVTELHGHEKNDFNQCEERAFLTCSRQRAAVPPQQPIFVFFSCAWICLHSTTVTNLSPTINYFLP